MQSNIRNQNGNVFRGVGYGLLFSSAITICWIAIISAIF